MTPEASTKSWFTLAVTVEPAAVEAVEFFFNEIDALGTETGGFHLDPAGPVTVTGYFDAAPDESKVAAVLERALAIYGHGPDVIRLVKTHSTPAEDWLAEWKRHWRPTRVGRFLIAPPWAELHETDDIVIRIEPNMAFGTGTHETTRLCLQAIDEYFRPGMSFLDVGTGTGILAIAAAKLAEQFGETSPRIAACDTDPDAIRIARENAALNSAGDIINFNAGSIAPESPAFEFICANLTLGAIVSILDLLLEKSTRFLVLSGILAEQREEILSQLNNRRINSFSMAEDGEWVDVVIEAE